MKKLLSVIILLFICFNLMTAQKPRNIQIKEGWKFSASDSLKFSERNYDDSGWSIISIDKNWEDQGHEKLDGYAWYRIRIFIPTSLKNESPLKDSLKIFLGKIDDYDQSYLNGKIFGVNGRNVKNGTSPDESYMKEQPIPWNKNRNYTLSASDPRILWDNENVIAVRVYDQGGAGGMFSGDAFIGMIGLDEYLECNYNQMQFELKSGRVSKSFYLKNSSALYTIGGKFTIKAEDKTDGKIRFEKKYEIDLKPGALQNFSYSFDNGNSSSEVNYVFEYAGNGMQTVFTDEAPYILTPPESPAPGINGAKIYGQRPGMPFLYTIAASGKRPMTFEASNLPGGLKLDKKTGIITGTVSETGIYKVKLTAKNKFGSAKGDLKIVIGETIALTPPMGWNSWNVWGLAVDQNKVLASARVFKEKGLMNHGWSYINIDDGWEIPGNSAAPKRDENGNIICNSKFPDMKALGDSIHSLGLKFGIYSSPGPLTCGGYTASYKYEINDARSYASWGIDYLKYDWCSYDNIAKDHSLSELKKPYFIMREALDKTGRDIVFSLCQYGMGNVWEWGSSVGGNSWRTTGDITDTWQSMSEIGFGQIENAKYARPGNWNDPDMLVVGWVGWGPNLHPARLTPDEQYTHISLWSLLSAPLLIGCDLTRLDDFTLSLLTNDEVIAVNQDPLGKQAVQKINKNGIKVWVKEIEGGGKVAGIFNTASGTQKFSLNFSEIGAAPKNKIRDIWRQKNLGVSEEKFETSIVAHGVILIKLQNP